MTTHPQAQQRSLWYIKQAMSQQWTAMQVRMSDVKLDDMPKFLTEDPTDESHAISCEDNMGTLINITLAL